MPVKTGSSHGMALLVCTILAGFLAEVLRPVVPHGMNIFQRLADQIVALVELPMNAEQIAVMLFAATLAFAWGVAFKVRTGGR